ncbi:hypothetical protein jhhlp_001924, partial [Lomentospora prolificans]
QTHHSVRSVHLIGSWDNFTSSYPLERDSRRDRGQWKGCYSFTNITCDDNTGVGPSRNGGLKMGSTYHYYYELDGCHETHDPARPSTRHCPYMPGQTVNTLFVPIQRTLRKRSASLSSMRNADFMTMNPEDKYTTPRPAPPVPVMMTGPRLGSSPHTLRHHASARSLSPNPSWRRFFRRSIREDREQAASPDQDDTRSERSWGSGSRSRDISPESLRRFLCDDTIPTSPVDERPVMIPEDIAEEVEDDDNFATPDSLDVPYTTCLAPPPFKRTVSSTSVPPFTNPEPAVESVDGALPESPTLPDFEPTLRSRFSFSSISSYASSVGVSPEVETPPLYDLLDSLEFAASANEVDESMRSSPVPRQSLERQYSLPQTAVGGSKESSNTLISSPIDMGMDDLVAELGWMATAIKN